MFSSVVQTVHILLVDCDWAHYVCSALSREFQKLSRFNQINGKIRQCVQSFAAYVLMFLGSPKNAIAIVWESQLQLFAIDCAILLSASVSVRA